MDFKYPDIYKDITKIVDGNVINLSKCDFIHPWAIILVCLLLVERHTTKDTKLILPAKVEVLSYLKRIHFDSVLKLLGYQDAFGVINNIQMNEKENLNLLEINCCRYRDDFNARLDSFYKIFKNIGLDENQARMVVAVVGELGNNVFDHNLGNWPTDISGCFIVAQNYPKDRRLELVIGDPGIGFLGSLKTAYPVLNDDLSAIKMGLSGKTGWVDTKRGNGLIFVQNTTQARFSGNIVIHSGSGLVAVEKDRIEGQKVNKILGTAIQIMLYY